MTMLMQQQEGAEVVRESRGKGGRRSRRYLPPLPLLPLPPWKAPGGVGIGRQHEERSVSKRNAEC